MSTGEDVLRADGYRFTAGVRTVDDDYDMQGHVNNVAIVRWYNQQRIRYVSEFLHPEWGDHLRREGLVVVAKELHVDYQSEGMPGEAFVCGTRVTKRRGKAGILEQRVVERDAGRPLARAWLVQLLAKDGRAVEWPEWYWEKVEAYEQRPIPDEGRAARAPWGP